MTVYRHPDVLLRVAEERNVPVCFLVIHKVRFNAVRLPIRYDTYS